MIDEKLYSDKYTLHTLTEFGIKRKQNWQVHLFRGFFPPLSSNAKILEVGSGRGEFAQECRNRDYNYTGIEPSDSLSELLIEKGYNIVKDRVPPINFPDNSFDLVSSMDLVEHFLSYNEVLGFFSECYRILKQGGYITIIAPNYSTLKELFYEYEYQHSYPTTEARLIKLLEDSGFKIIKHKAFLISPGWKYFQYIDRLIAYILIPISRNMIFRAFLKSLTSQKFLFKIHKNLHDHVGVIAQKV